MWDAEGTEANMYASSNSVKEAVCLMQKQRSEIAEKRGKEREKINTRPERGALWKDISVPRSPH